MTSTSATSRTVVTPLLRPDYATLFRCIGPACEDTCCAGWSVPLDEASCRKYEAVAAGPLKVLLDANVVRHPANEDGTAVATYAKVRLGADSVCPFLDAGKLCRIQTELGESYLSKTCAAYPRIVHQVDGLEEKALALSCPEAARLVLFSEDLLHVPGVRQYRQSWEIPEATGRQGQLDAGQRAVALKERFWPVREFVIRLIRSRDYALWQRLFLLGVFVQQLDAMGAGDTNCDVAALLGSFRGAVEDGSFRAGMEGIAPDLRTQLDLVLRLAGLQLSRSHVGERFVQTASFFTQGIGYAPGMTMEQLLRGYAKAYRRSYEPFFDRHLQVLENLLINLVFKRLFPYGLLVGRADWKPVMQREFALLVAQFALIKGLLIGVAGFHRKGFNPAHVVQTVQSASKHFEHHPGFLEEAHALLVERGLDNPLGLTMLLRN